MNKYIKISLFGFFIWLIPFIVSFIIFGLHKAYRPLFESIMTIIVAFVVVIFSVLIFKEIDQYYIKKGAIIGGIWILICLLIDIIIMVLMESLMQMSVGDYIMDVGLTYLIIPIITIGFGVVLEQRL